ncbi:winged helix-turn-helix domain-containing tetratricopeptide repeat protein [Bradyrhizobium sp. CB1650]|uniref:winged helix-turn-helix domain-containing tetratricopeptide repeat protein n=1 Tax=Bradyrhizobium sp. CB1650 TaxID=3039153 RepID=UPI0024359737|nr:winged helix-turn-helix domain-containing tetratricopeptide repeat protein [Bradyrhizobium sp. CB1650]WGD49136.1 winged helix-turn-helix domain-containing tetratricopeptide repeat protein [Bradyrhizobium sp. CB1650]
MRYLFEEYVFDTDRRELHRGAAVVPVAPQVFDILDYLIRNRERVVSKDDLMNAIWNGRIVSEAALTTRLNAARTAIGDCGEQQRLIKTLPRKGFRFVGAVREKDGNSDSATASVSRLHVLDPAPALPDEPSIAVLPFANMTGDPEQEYFADGMVEEITTALSRFKWLFVIARISSFTFKGRVVDIKEIGHRLGVRYVLEGSVRKASGRVRVAGQLIDAVTGAHIWANSYERDLSDIFLLQDEITAAVVCAILPKLMRTEIVAAARRRPENLTAYDLQLRAMAQYSKATPKGLAEAIRLANRALELDPRLGFVAALAGLSHMVNVVLGFASDPDFDRREAVRFLRLATRVDDSDPQTLSMAAVISAFMLGDYEGSIEMVDRAVALNPNSYWVWLDRGWVYHTAGVPEEAIRCFEHAMRMSPIDPLLDRLSVGMGMAFIELRRFEEAIAAARKALRQNPSFWPAFGCLAAALAHLGRDAEAREAAARLLELDPAFTISIWVARGGQSNAKIMREGLRKAGLPQ